MPIGDLRNGISILVDTCNTTSEWFKQEIVVILRNFTSYEQLKLHAQLIRA